MVAISPITAKYGDGVAMGWPVGWRWVGDGATRKTGKTAGKN